MASILQNIETSISNADHYMYLNNEFIDEMYDYYVEKHHNIDKQLYCICNDNILQRYMGSIHPPGLFTKTEGFLQYLIENDFIYGPVNINDSEHYFLKHKLKKLITAKYGEE
jgi:hypothetical protein